MILKYFGTKFNSAHSYTVHCTVYITAAKSRLPGGWIMDRSVFRIRMDPGLFADPDFKNPDPDPSINKLMGSK